MHNDKKNPTYLLQDLCFVVFCIHSFILRSCCINSLDVCFFLGVAEQFAIAEAKLRAWASIDEDDAEDSNDEDSHTNGQTHTFSDQSSGIYSHHHFVNFHLISLIVFITASSLTKRLIFPPPPPIIHPSPGVLTFCSSLRHPHVQSYHRSAMPA